MTETDDTCTCHFIVQLFQDERAIGQKIPMVVLTPVHFGIVFKALGEDFPRHPTQLYEAFGYLIIFLLLWYFYWKTDKKEQLGFLFGFFFATLWSVRFLIEFLKEAQIEERGNWDLNTGQLLSVPLIVIGMYYMFRKKQ